MPLCNKHIVTRSYQKLQDESIEEGSLHTARQTTQKSYS